MMPLSLHGFALDQGGHAATFALPQGQSLVVVGPAASGKSRFLAACTGRDRPARGSAKLGGTVSFAGFGAGRRQRPQHLAQREKGAERAASASEALYAVGLWDFRQTLLSDLSPAQVAGCELLAPLASLADLLVIDGQLDRLDPWALKGALNLLRKRLADGGSAIVATNRLDLLTEFDWVVVLSAGQIRYAGLIQDLRKHSPETVVVSTENQAAVRALGKPFEVVAEECEEGLKLSASGGQELAAKLLLQGYGDIRYVLTKRDHPAEAVFRLLAGR